MNKMNKSNIINIIYINTNGINIIVVAIIVFTSFTKFKKQKKEQERVDRNTFSPTSTTIQPASTTITNNNITIYQSFELLHGDLFLCAVQCNQYDNKYHSAYYWHYNVDPYRHIFVRVKLCVVFENRHCSQEVCKQTNPQYNAILLRY